MKNTCARIAAILLVMLLSLSTVAWAEIPINNGLGDTLIAGIGSLTNAVKNCSNTLHGGGATANKGWLNVETVTLENEAFTDAVRVKCSGTDAAPATNQIRFLFDTDTLSADDYVYVSFYYRARSSMDGVAYDTPPSFGMTAIQTSSGILPSLSGSAYFEANEPEQWRKAQYIYALKTTVEAGNRYLQLSFSKPQTGLSPYCIEFAGLTAIYFGAVTGPSDAIIQNELKAVLGTAGFSKITVQGEEIDLAEHPERAYLTQRFSGTMPEIKAYDQYGTELEVTYDPTVPLEQVVVSSYAPLYDLFPGQPDDLSQTYRRDYVLLFDYVGVETELSVDTAVTTSLDGCSGGETVKLHAKLYNITGSALQRAVLLGIYRGQKCVRMLSWPVELAATKTEAAETFSYVLPDADWNGATLKAFVLSIPDLNLVK